MSSGFDSDRIIQEYDKSSIPSIMEFALQLTGKSLSEVAQLPTNIVNVKNRGDLGTLIEVYFFKHQPPSNHGPDFPEAGLELKTTGVILKNGKYRAKERLVLTKINYKELIEESWENSNFNSKCNKMLIMFYLFTKELSVIDRKFVVNPMLFDLSKADWQTIKRDWEFIQNKVQQGKAHELSEGDTFLLGACRKGSGGPHEKLQTQPNSNIGAPARAFSLKQSYINSLLEQHLAGIEVLPNKLEITFEEKTLASFDNFLGKSVDEIAASLKFEKRDKNHKSFYREIATKLLSLEGAAISDLRKAGIEAKTIRLQKNGKPKESMSFPAFKYMEIVSQDWEDSDFYEQIESRFLFVVFKVDSQGVDRLEKVFYWNMPYESRLEAKRVWEDAKLRIGVNARDLPKKSESRVAHVRPHGANSRDVDVTPQGELLVKKCFWLNLNYIAEVCALK